MLRKLRSRLGVRATVERWWGELLGDRLRGRPRCALLTSLHDDPSLAHRNVGADVDRIVHTIVGRRLTRFVVGRHPHRHSLTDFIASGVPQAARLLPYVQPHERILEYGGGVGRLGRAVAPSVQQLVSVDIEPLMKEYGLRLSPGVEFRNLDELADAPAFDGAYSVAVFFHLTLVQQKRALEYVHRRLKPRGWFLVDLRIGPRTTGPTGRPGNTGDTALEDFRALYEPLFTAEPVPLFNSGFLMRKKESRGGPEHQVGMPHLRQGAP